MTDLPHLISRLEQGSGEDREIHYDLDCLVLWGPQSEWKNAGGGYEQHKVTGERRQFGLWTRGTPNYTGSIDAALAFAAAVLPDMNCHGYDGDPGCVEAYVSRNQVKAGHWLSIGEHKDSVPRAMVIAVLKRLAGLHAKETGNG